MESVIISADEIKKELPDYDPARSGDFHRESARIADKEYEKELKNNKHIKKVILLSGGSASGKTEYLSGYLTDKDAIIVDGTLSNPEGFEIKRRKAVKNSKKVYVYSVIPDNLLEAFIAFLARDRKYNEKYFYETHARSRATLLKIAQNYPEVPITIIKSYFTRGNKMKFEELSHSNKKELIDYLETIQYNEDDIRKIIFEL